MRTRSCFSPPARRRRGPPNADPRQTMCGSRFVGSRQVDDFLEKPAPSPCPTGRPADLDLCRHRSDPAQSLVSPLSDEIPCVDRRRRCELAPQLEALQQWSPDSAEVYIHNVRARAVNGALTRGSRPKQERGKVASLVVHSHGALERSTATQSLEKLPMATAKAGRSRGPAGWPCARNSAANATGSPTRVGPHCQPVGVFRSRLLFRGVNRPPAITKVATLARSSRAVPSPGLC